MLLADHFLQAGRTHAHRQRRTRVPAHHGVDRMLRGHRGTGHIEQTIAHDTNVTDPHRQRDMPFPRTLSAATAPS
ncbi:hypothetical protein IFM12275_02640 [Nocardia sputorum]|uniref:Uncharacterized protein n=1 Tax=Nocardia sputorum TaxID=2984338 RepID=A0ABM8CVB0_9NOCA|nr:hypothetical protein IFM12275_02640 [Nocardia sputorum]BDT98908.1 hypothetical protein IFM12276_19370 [Nocardia sputorum]